ncbi:hypothetical protein V1515DRAFT_335212 [Lipomyces mesembrius]
MSLLAYISNSHNYNYQTSASPALSLSACGSPSNSSYGASYSQSQHRHDPKGVHPIAKVLHREEARRGSTSLVHTSRPFSSDSGSNSDRTLKFCIPQMADELRYAADGQYEQRVPQQQLHDPAGLGQFPDNEEDISPTRLPSIQALLTTASTSASGSPATSETGKASNLYTAPSGSSTASATEGLTRSSISSSTSSKSTSSAPARLSPAMTTTTRTLQSGYILAPGSTSQAQPPLRMPHTSGVSSAAIAAAAALQMPTTVYPQQQFMYPGPPPGMPAPQIHPPPLPHYMAAPQPYYMPSAQAGHGAYPPAHPYAGLAPQYPPLHSMQLAPGMSFPIVPAAQTHLAPLKPKRKRATQQQVNRLNEVFQQTFFPSTEQRLELSRELGMTPRTVQIWFQNRRQGWRAESRRSSGGQEGHDQRLHQQPGDVPGEDIDVEDDVSE